MCDNSSIFQSLGTPETYSLVVHTIFIIGMPINIFAAYCVLFRTPRRMDSVKYAMVVLNLTTTLFDIYLSLLVIPFLFFPLLAGFPLGFLSVLGVSSEVQIYFALCLVQCTGVAVLVFFENRYHNLIHSKYTSTSSTLKRIVYVLLNYLFAATFFLPAYLNIPNLETGKDFIKTNLKCLRSNFLDHPNFFIYAIDNSRIELLFFLAFGSYLCQLAFFGINISKHLISQKTTSTKTYKMQMRFFRAMNLQLFIMLVILSVPLGMIIATVVANYYSQPLNNILLVCLSLHGSASSATMVIIHKPYREILFGLFHGLCCNRKLMVQPKVSENNETELHNNRKFMTTMVPVQRT